jgi:hypothetical protein
MSGPDGTGGQTPHQDSSAREAQYGSAPSAQYGPARDPRYGSARDAQFESAREPRWQPGVAGQSSDAGYPLPPGYPGNPYPPVAGSGAAGFGSTGAGGQAAGQQVAGEYGPGQYPTGHNNPGHNSPGQGQPGQFSPGQFNPGQFGAAQYGSGNPYPPPPAWGQSNPLMPDQPGHLRPGNPPEEQGQRRRPARTLNPEKALGVAVAVLGGLNFIFGFLPQYTGGSTTGNFSVYAVGPGYVPILLLIAGLLALAAFVPGSERSRLAVAAVSVGGAVAAVISIGTTSPGTSSLGTGLGAILVTVFGIVQAVIAIGGYVVGAGISPLPLGPATAGPATPGTAIAASASAKQPAPVDPAAVGGWVEQQGAAADWPGVMPGQRPGPADDQRGSAPMTGRPASGQGPAGPWQAGQYYAAPAAPDQSYGSPASPGQPSAAEPYARQSYGQSTVAEPPGYARPNPGNAYPSPGYPQPSPGYVQASLGAAQPSPGRSFSSPSYTEQSHAGQGYFGQPPVGQYPPAESAPPPRQDDPVEPNTGPQSVVGMESPGSWPLPPTGSDPAGQPSAPNAGNSVEQDQRRSESQSDVVDLVKPTEAPPTAG